MYYGKPKEREELRCRLVRESDRVQVVIVSYEILRIDCEFFQSLDFSYLVLDEGHVVRSTKNLLSQVVQSLRANYRLILSGTPVQNSVSDIWCLFSFLMSGYLGTEKQFNKRFSRVVSASRKSGGAATSESAILALTELQKQVAPFMLRRLKSEVMRSLPAKIIQDYYCSLSLLQKCLYDEFDGGAAVAEGEDRRHVFQELLYLRKVCNHPSLVCEGEPMRFEHALGILGGAGAIEDVEQSGKLMALCDLLNECGFNSTGPEHKALIFCQMRRMVELVTSLVLSKLSSAKHLKIDGHTPTDERANIVKKFNKPNSDYNILVLTTQVGGLGLNLTAADVVIFVEHDWNPTKDLQAMDRAHRIGQTKTVNVYRLITKDTIEERIMNLQSFKSALATTLVDQVPLGKGEIDRNPGDVLEMLAAGAAEPEQQQVMTNEQRMHEQTERDVQAYEQEFHADKITQITRKRKGGSPRDAAE